MASISSIPAVSRNTIQQTSLIPFIAQELRPAVVNRNVHLQAFITGAYSPAVCDSIHTSKSSPHALSTFPTFSNSAKPTSHASSSTSLVLPSPSIQCRRPIGMRFGYKSVEESGAA
ncbi:hypothetical protein VTO58DRAFT_107271 [Aureobasidium pullulans]